MSAIIFGILFIIPALIMVPIINYYRKSESRFRQNCIEYDAYIVGYVREDNVKWDTPQVTVVKEGDDSVYRCQSRRMSELTHPRGTKVRVAFYTSNSFGKGFTDVRIIDPEYGPLTASAVQKALIATSLIFLTISVFLVIIGIRSI